MPCSRTSGPWHSLRPSCPPGAIQAGMASTAFCLQGSVNTKKARPGRRLYPQGLPRAWHSKAVGGGGAWGWDSCRPEFSTLLGVAGPEASSSVVQGEASPAPWPQGTGARTWTEVGAAALPQHLRTGPSTWQCSHLTHWLLAPVQSEAVAWGDMGREEAEGRVGVGALTAEALAERM